MPFRSGFTSGAPLHMLSTVCLRPVPVRMSDLYRGLQVDLNGCGFGTDIRSWIPRTPSHRCRFDHIPLTRMMIRVIHVTGQGTARCVAFRLPGFFYKYVSKRCFKGLLQVCLTGTLSFLSRRPDKSSAQIPKLSARMKPRRQILLCALGRPHLQSTNGYQRFSGKRGRRARLSSVLLPNLYTRGDSPK
jgi:hypothetical protein